MNPCLRKVLLVVSIIAATATTLALVPTIIARGAATDIFRSQVNTEVKEIVRRVERLETLLDLIPRIDERLRLVQKDMEGVRVLMTDYAIKNPRP